MAWQVTIMLDETNEAIIRETPCWALETPTRRSTADEVGHARNNFWAPEPALTLFKAGGSVGEIAILSNMLDIVLEHDPHVVGLDLVGISSSPELSAIMLERGFEFKRKSDDGLEFLIPMAKIHSVPMLVMDASSWNEGNDLFDSFFAVVGAPDWHGRNFNALDDSIVSGGINRIELPYVLLLKSLDKAGPKGRVLAQEFSMYVRELEARGCPISILIRDGDLC